MQRPKKVTIVEHSCRYTSFSYRGKNYVVRPEGLELPYEEAEEILSSSLKSLLTAVAISCPSGKLISPMHPRFEELSEDPKKADEKADNETKGKSVSKKTAKASTKVDENPPSLSDADLLKESQLDVK